MIRVLIAEDQGLVRGALAALLNLEPDIDVVAEASDGEEALRLACTAQPDVALVDVEMPKLSGLEVAQRLHEQVSRCRVLMVTTFARPGYLQRAMRAGASGYLLKDAQVEELADAIRTVHRGGQVINPALMMEAWSNENPLTTREADVLRCAAEGLSTREIAGRCYLSEGTVRNYLSEVMSKLHVQSRQEAVKIATDKGWI